MAIIGISNEFIKSSITLCENLLTEKPSYNDIKDALTKLDTQFTDVVAYAKLKQDRVVESNLYNLASEWLRRCSNRTCCLIRQSAFRPFARAYTGSDFIAPLFDLRGALVLGDLGSPEPTEFRTFDRNLLPLIKGSAGLPQQ